MIKLWFTIIFLLLSFSVLPYGDDESVNESSEGPINLNSESLENVDLKKLIEDNPDLKNQLESAMKNFKGISVGENGMPNLDNMSMKDSVKMLNGIYKDKSEDEIVNQLKEQHKGNQLGGVLNKYPKVGTFFAKLYKDEHALTKMVEILDNRDKLMWFAFANLGTIIFGWLLKRSFRRKEEIPFIRSVKLFFVRLSMVYGARLIIMISFYGKNLKPIARVFYDTFIV